MTQGEKLEEAKRLYKDANADQGYVLERLFPELKESEDERIRKYLIDVVNDYCKGSEHDGCIAWLEKQGENAYNKELSELLHKVICRFINDPDIPYSDREKVSMKVVPYVERLENQGEQKPFDYENANIQQKDFASIKPKFKVGDWIVSDVAHEDYRICKILNDDDEYVIESIYGYRGYNNFETFDKDYHLWAIQDAKDGDVLSFNDGHGNDCIELIKSITDKKIEFWFCLTNGNYYEVFDGIIPYTNLVSREDATPATKEQRALLFQMMKEAGYEWDAENKELKKIEQNPAWSEEDDENMIMIEDRLSDYLDYIREDSSITKHRKNSLKEEVIGYVNWLKSLKGRYTWKPSDEQIKVCKEVYADLLSAKGFNVGTINSELNRMEEQLKKLREE